MIMILAFSVYFVIFNVILLILVLFLGLINDFNKGFTYKRFDKHKRTLTDIFKGFMFKGFTKRKYFIVPFLV